MLRTQWSGSVKYGYFASSPPWKQEGTVSSDLHREELAELPEAKRTIWWGPYHGLSLESLPPTLASTEPLGIIITVQALRPGTDSHDAFHSCVSPVTPMLVCLSRTRLGASRLPSALLSLTAPRGVVDFSVC